MVLLVREVIRIEGCFTPEKGAKAFQIAKEIGIGNRLEGEDCCTLFLGRDPIIDMNMILMCIGVRLRTDVLVYLLLLSLL